MVSSEAVQEIKKLVHDFTRRSVKRIKELSAQELLKENAINPFLVKALGIKEFEPLARYYVYQRIGRSWSTSFGTTVQHIVTRLAEGETSEWWDVRKETPAENWYMSVKSGPQDMDKDQVELFAQRARRVMRDDPKALPMIAMAYGRNLWSVINDTLRNEGLNPQKHTYLGRKLYEKITGESNYHVTLLQIVNDAALQAVQGERVIGLVEGKVEEVTRYFEANFKTVDDLLLSLF